MFVGLAEKRKMRDTKIDRNFPGCGGDRPLAVEVPSAPKQGSVAFKISAIKNFSAQPLSKQVSPTHAAQI